MKILFRNISLPLTILPILMFSCFYDNEETLYPDNCDLTNSSFPTVIMPIIETNCAVSGCHVQGTGRVDLSSYQGVVNIANDGQLVKKAFVEKSMPPARPLSNCNIKLIQAWMDNGMQAN